MPIGVEHPLPFLEDAVRRAPSELSYRTLLAEACLREGDTARAIEILASSLDAAAKPRTICVLALALVALERHGEAKSAATEVIRLNSSMDRAYYIRALARRAQGDVAGALTDLRIANEARSDAEYALAFARTALEAAIAKSPSVTTAVLQSADRSLASIAATDGDLRERGHLGALLAFALDDPAKAVERLASDGTGTDKRLALLRGYALLATGRGAEATTDLRAARDVPETSAAASRFLTAFRERGRVSASLTEAILAAGEPSWPDLKAVARRLMPPPAGEWPYDAEAPAASHEDAIDFDFDTTQGPPPRTPTSETEAALERARKLLAEGRHDDAVVELENAWELVRPGTSPLPATESLPRHRLQALAEALAAAYEQSARNGASTRRVRDEELYAAGARYPAMLRSLVWRFSEYEPREDYFALDVLVTAVETADVLDRNTARDVLRALAFALRMELEDDSIAIQVRVQLLERLHRSRPGLTFPRLYLGRHAIQHGDPDRALAFLEGMAGPLAASAQVLYLRGLCAESLGDPEWALDLYRLAHARAPQIPDLSYRIGRVLIRRAAKSAAPSGTRRHPPPATETQAGA